MNTLTALKRCSLGLGLYLYESPGGRCTVSSERTPDKTNDRVTVRNFQRKFLRELKKIKLAWPSLNYSTAKGVLILLPSTPSILPGQQAFTPGVEPSSRALPAPRIAPDGPSESGAALSRDSGPLKITPGAL